MILAVALIGVTASAQSLSDLFKNNSKAASIFDAASSVFGAVTGITNAVDLTGTWTYQGAAVNFSGENTLSNLASTAASGTIESKMNEYLSKVGVSAGAMKFTFASDGTFTATVKNIPLSGTWTNDNGAVKLVFGKSMKYLQMDGVVKATSGGCELLFTADRFLKFAKTLASAIGSKNSSVAAVSSILDSYDNLSLGFKLSK